MIDQKDKFVKRGIQAEFVGKSQENTEAMSAVANGDIQLVYISPESLLCNLQFRNMVLFRQMQKKFTGPEAHCIKLWYVHYDVALFISLYCYFLEGEKISKEHLQR